MQIVKYEKKGNNNYQIIFDNNTKVSINEDIILKHKLLYKKEIDEYYLSELIKENNNYNIYDKCVKYIGIRLRSIHEIREFMLRKGVDKILIEETINKLLKNKLLDDKIFAHAFTKDKFNFTSMGPYRIKMELQKEHISNDIIDECLNEIDDKLLKDKIDKQINKLIKSNKNKPNLKNKIYHSLYNLGYSEYLINDSLNKYNL